MSPTTHLDVDAVEALVRALTDYQGTLVFISHDIYFVRSVANVVFEVKNGQVRKFHGNFDYYFEKKDAYEGLENVAHKPKVLKQASKAELERDGRRKKRKSAKRERGRGRFTILR